ncbi:MAG: succinate dehydrogenase, hydrophobic membrane anchor protein [gamma proteobacterium symbiont of Phacoides pectinatus]
MSRQASGFRAWVLQRISAVYLGVYLVYLLGFIAIAPPQSFEAWRTWMAHPVVSFTLLLFFVSLFVHAWVGVRDVVLDYVKPYLLRVLVLSVFAFGLIGSGLWVAKVIFLAGQTV